MDSCLAGSIKLQVLTMMTSASSARGVSSKPCARQNAQHHFAVHKVLGTAQTDHSNFGHSVLAYPRPTPIWAKSKFYHESSGIE